MTYERAPTDEEIREAEQFHAAALPLWREAFLGLDWLSLRASSVYRGINVPKGDGSPVVVIPGFLGSDRYLGDLYTWLRRLGYQPHMSAIGRNVECPNVISDRLLKTIENARAQTGRKVHLIGHSLGGVLARSAAGRWPELVGSIVTLASPFRGVRVHPLVLELSGLVRSRIMARADPQIVETCYTAECGCDFRNALLQPFPASIPQVAIYTRTDGVVDWRRCINGDPEVDVEVSGTHAGLVFNPQVYRHIANHLASTL